MTNRPPQKEAGLLNILWHVALRISCPIVCVVSGYQLLTAVVSRILCHEGTGDNEHKETRK